jgi:hypothetical protein
MSEAEIARERRSRQTEFFRLGRPLKRPLATQPRLSYLGVVACLKDGTPTTTAQAEVMLLSPIADGPV